jgi:hypothetical protein
MTGIQQDPAGRPPIARRPSVVLASWMLVNLDDSRNATLGMRPEVRTRFFVPREVRPPGPDPVELMYWRI